MNIRTSILEFAQWYKALHYDAMKRLLLEALPKIPQRLAYQLTLVKNSSDEISAELVKRGHKVSSKTIRNWHAEWIRSGLVTAVSERKRSRNFNLKDFGIPFEKMEKHVQTEMKTSLLDSIEAA